MECVITAITCSLDTLRQTHVNVTESSDNYFGALVTLSCDRDYKLVSGSLIRRCLADGSWSGEKLTCKGMYQAYTKQKDCRHTGKKYVKRTGLFDINYDVNHSKKNIF